MTMTVKYKVNVPVEGEFDMADSAFNRLADILAGHAHHTLRASTANGLNPENVFVVSLTVVKAEAGEEDKS